MTARAGVGLAAALLLAAAGLGCFSPKIGDGTLGCTDAGVCPRGFSCGLHWRCWRAPDGGDDDDAASAIQEDGGAGVGGSAAAGGRAGGDATAGAGGVASGGRAGADAAAGAAGADAAAGTAGGSGGRAGADAAAGTSGGHPGTDAAAGAAGGVAGGRAGADAAAGAAGGVAAGGRAGADAAAGTAGGSASGGRAGTGAPGGTGAGKAPLGTPCAAGAECASELCVDAVCCDGDCKGSCEACDTAAGPGRCLPVTSGPPRGLRERCGGSGACAGSCNVASRTACTFSGGNTECRPQTCGASTLMPAAFCDGAGACAAATPRACGGSLVCNDAGTACLTACRADADCLAPTPYCQGTMCTAARPNSVACSSDGQCQSGRCVDGVCCDSSCTGQCQACDVTGHLGSCWPVPARQTPHGQRDACPGNNDVCAGYCNGSAAACVFPGSETDCPCKLLSGSCNQAGQCALLGNLCI